MRLVKLLEMEVQLQRTRIENLETKLEKVTASSSASAKTIIYLKGRLTMLDRGVRDVIVIVGATDDKVSRIIKRLELRFEIMYPPYIIRDGQYYVVDVRDGQLAWALERDSAKRFKTKARAMAMVPDGARFQVEQIEIAEV